MFPSSPLLSVRKRKALDDITNVLNDEDSNLKSDASYNVGNLMPVLEVDNNKLSSTSDTDRFQNVHPLLGWYKHDLKTGGLSYDTFMDLMDPDNGIQLLNLLTQIGVIAKENTCLLCGGGMRKMKDGHQWFWICTRRVNGVKCNKGRKSIRTGTFLGGSHLGIQDILKIIWHFVHHLSEKQCVEYTKLSSKNNHTIVKWYRFCREVCTNWFWKPENTPKLGGFGKIVEMDESFFPGKPKYNNGRRLGDDVYEDDEKWGFGLTERGSLDVIILQVPSNRARKHLIPIIDQHCLPGTIFCSDGWKAYNKLKDHLLLEDCEHFTVNHSKNYVDPETGAYTQTIEGVWNHCKQFLPAFGMKPKDLHTYIGSFLWTRYCKQRKLDMFVHFLKSAAELHPPVVNELPNGIMVAL